MAAKVAFRVFYIELIICGFLACVLVARNLCVSETGVPISCSVSRHGNATGKFASDGNTSGVKVKVQSEGEVMNMGARRSKVKIEKRFKPLFLVSSGLKRPAAPRAPATGKRISHLLGVGGNVPGKNAVEPQWSEERSEVVQSRGQLPEEESAFEFLDMFEVSDLQPDRRRQKAEAERRAGLKERGVDSKTDWHLLKHVEKDGSKAKDGSKIQKQSDASEDKHIKSEREEDDEVAFKSVISKAKPIRIKAMIVTNGIGSKALTANAEDANSTKDQPLSDPRAPSIVPHNDFQSISASVMPGNSLNKTNASLVVSKEANPDSKDSPSSEASASSLEIEQSDFFDFSDDNPGFFANILSAVLQGDRSIEAPYELAFDEVDILEGDKGNLGDDISDKSLDGFAESNDGSVAKEDGNKSTGINQHTEENGKLVAAAAAAERDAFEEAGDRSEVVENDFGGDKDIARAVKHVSREPDNSNGDRANVATHGGGGYKGENLVVSLIQGQHVIDYIAGTKHSSPHNEKDTSNGSRKDSYHAENVKEEIVQAGGNKFHKEAADKSSTSKDNIPMKLKDFQMKATYVLVKAKNITESTRDDPVRGQYIPVKSRLNHVKGKYIPVIAKVVRTDTAAISEKTEGTRAQPADTYRKARNITQNRHDLSRDVPREINEILAKALDLPARVEHDIPTRANDLPSTFKGIPIEEENVAKEVADMPTTGEGIPKGQRNVSETGNDLSAKTESTAIKEGLSDNMPAKAEDVPKIQEDLSEKQNDLPTNAMDIMPKQENLPEKQNDMLAKAKDIPIRKEDLSDNQNDMPSEAEDATMQDEPVNRQMEDGPADSANASSSVNDTEGQDQRSSLDREAVKKATFTEIGNIMSDLNYLGALWEQLKPGVKVKHSDAVRRVLHAVADVFGLDNKDIAEPASSGKPGAVMLRYDVVEQGPRDGQLLKEFKYVSSRDVPGAQTKRIGLRSRRSVGGQNRRRRVEATNPVDQRSRRRHMDSKDRMLQKRRSGPYISQEEDEEDREEEEEEDREEEEDEDVAGEDIRNRRRDAHLMGKRVGYEDYIFGSNPGYVLSRRRRRRRDILAPAVMSDNGNKADDLVTESPVSKATDKADDKATGSGDDNGKETAEDKAEEDAISIELTELLIRQVYNRVMKTLEKSNLTSEGAKVAATHWKRGAMPEERRRRNAGRAGGDLRRSKRAIDSKDIQRYCKMLSKQEFNTTDDEGKEVDLYTQVVNSGLCSDYEGALAVERELRNRKYMEQVMVARETETEDDGKTNRQMEQDARSGVEGMDKVKQSEAETAIKGEDKLQAQREARRQINDEVERLAVRKAGIVEEGDDAVLEQAEEEAKRDDDEAEDETKRDDSDREAADEVKRDDGETEAEDDIKRDDSDTEARDKAKRDDSETKAEDEAKRDDSDTEVGDEAKRDDSETKAGEESEEMAREASDGPLEDQSDAWSGLSKAKMHAAFEAEGRAAIEEEKARQELKSGRRSTAEVDDPVADFKEYKDMRSDDEEDDEKAFEGQ